MATGRCRASLGLDPSTSLRAASRGRPSPHESSRPRVTFCRLLGVRLRGSACSGHFSDSRVACENEFAGAQRCFFEILRIGRKHLPAGHFLSQHLDGSHVGEVASQALVVLLGGGEPYAVVRGLAMFVFVPEDQNNLVLNVNRQAAEHGMSAWRERSDGVEYEFVRDRLALLDA